MSRLNKCGCKYSTTTDSAVRHGTSLSGGLLEECQKHREERLASARTPEGEAMTDTMNDERAVDALKQVRALLKMTPALQRSEYDSLGIAFNFALDYIAARLQAQQPGAQAVAWQCVDVPPDVDVDQTAYFFVACRRGRDGKVYSFPALYCNRKRLLSEKRHDASGPGWSQVAMPETVEDWDIEVTGWYGVETDETGEYDVRYQQVCGEDDAIIAWCQAPVYGGTATHPQPTSIPEPSDADIAAACEILDVNEAVSYMRERIRAALTTYTARLRERIGGGK